MKEWIRIVKFLSENFKNINSRVRPARINTTRWSSGHEALHSTFKNSSHFLAMYLTLHNILHTKKRSIYNLTPENLSLLRRLYKYWSVPENISKGFSLYVIFIEMNKYSTRLQTSCLPIIEMVPTVKACYKYVKDLCDSPAETPILASMNLESKTFLEGISHLIKEDIIQHILTDDKKEIELLSNIQNSNNNINPRPLNQSIKMFLKSLMENIEGRFIADFTDNVSKKFYEEINSLCPIKIMQYNSNTTISLKFLCKTFKLVESTVISEIKNMGYEFYSYHQQFSTVQSLNESFQNIDFNDSIKDYESAGTFDENTTPPIRDEWKSLSAFLSLNKDKYKSVLKLYQILMSLPCTQTKCERDFSVFKRTKTAIRSQLNDDNLESLMLLKLSADMLPNSIIPAIVDRIAVLSPQLKNILLDNTEH